jgi:hypothetical protein
MLKSSFLSGRKSSFMYAEKYTKFINENLNVKNDFLIFHGQETHASDEDTSFLIFIVCIVAKI